MSDQYAAHEFASRAELHRWLARHHRTSPGIWLVTYKRGDDRYLPRADVVEELLSFGWVDSLPRAVDSVRTSILATPRKPRSRWSKVNREIVERLIRANAMQPAGLEAVAAARSSGAWTALDTVEALDEPEDLGRALDASPTARREWDAFPRSVKRAILEWILAAKRPATREARIRETVSEAEAGRRANQWRQPKTKPASD